MADLEIYEIDSSYIEYLSNFEEHLFKNKKITQDFSRKYIGIILEINGFKYFAPLSSFSQNIDCLSLFFDAGGGLDTGYIEETADNKKLFLSGIIDWNHEKYINVNWSFLIEADDIMLMYCNYSPQKIDITHCL